MLQKPAAREERYPVVGTIKELRLKAQISNDLRRILSEFAKNLGQALDRGDAKHCVGTCGRMAHAEAYRTLSHIVYFLSLAVVPEHRPHLRHCPGQVR